MCPACVAGSVWVVTGVASTGGLTAAVATLIRKRVRAGKNSPDLEKIKIQKEK